jgi:hypothetical protein
MQVLAALGVEGCLVLEVPAGSPAAAAGLRPTSRDVFGDLVLGDIIVGLDTRPVGGARDLVAALDERKPGDKVSGRQEGTGRSQEGSWGHPRRCRATLAEWAQWKSGRSQEATLSVKAGEGAGATMHRRHEKATASTCGTQSHKPLLSASGAAAVCWLLCAGAV